MGKCTVAVVKQNLAQICSNRIKLMSKNTSTVTHVLPHKHTLSPHQSFAAAKRLPKAELCQVCENHLTIKNSASTEDIL